MTLFPFDEMFNADAADESPGVRLYFYRLLKMLASGDASDVSSPISYESAKRLSRKMNLKTPEKLVQFFKDVDLGTLTVDIRQDRLLVTLHRAASPPPAESASEAPCELERGLIDGALESITGIPVTTLETSCVTKGDSTCSFQASREMLDDTSFYKPVATGEREHHVSPSMANVMKHQQTGLRSWYLDAVGREIARSRRHNYPMSLLYLDLDNLGEINETLGTQAGDQVINAVASTLGRSCRAEDILWHHGEDEFIISLAETNTGCAEVVARRLLTEVLSAAEYVDFAASISASIGFSTFPGHAANLTDLFESARSALYLAKSLGKNRVQVACKESDITIDAGYHECQQRGDSLFDWPAYRPGRRKGDALSEEEQAGRTDEAEVESIVEPPGTAQEPAEYQPPGTAEPIPDQRVPREPPPLIEEPHMEEPEIDVVPVEAEAPMPAESGPENSAVAASVSPILLQGMRQVLAPENGFKVVGDIKDPGKMTDVIADLEPKLVFTDKEMAVADNFLALQMYKDDFPAGKFIIFTTDVDQDILRAAVDYDVDGIIFQDSSPKDVLASINLVMQGKRVLPENVQTAIDELEHHRLLLNELSERELEVLRLVAAGKSNSQISKELYITVNTVRFHLANIYQKLNVSNRTEAANYFLRQGLDSGENA